MKFKEETIKIWFDYHLKITGSTDSPEYYDGCLWHWISKHQPMNQTEILDICYEAGYKAGSKKGYAKAKNKYRGDK